MAKRLAVADEDYDKAKEIKDEVDILRAEIEEKVRLTLISWNLNLKMFTILVSFGIIAIISASNHIISFLFLRLVYTWIIANPNECIENNRIKILLIQQIILILITLSESAYDQENCFS